MAALPPGIGYGKVIAQVGVITLDGVDDDDDPDFLRIGGEVVFTPNFKGDLATRGTDAQLLFADKVPATIDPADGILKNKSGKPYVSLLSSSSTALNNRTWTWTVAFIFEGRTRASFPFTIEPGDLLNLADLIPVAISEGTITIAGPPGRDGVIDEAQLDDVKADILGAVQADVQSLVSQGLSSHVNSTSPHAVYDEMNDLALYFENGMA